MTHSSVLEKIAIDHFSVKTLEVRNRDELDFHDVHVGSIASGLKAAFDAGSGAGMGRTLAEIVKADQAGLEEGNPRFALQGIGSDMLAMAARGEIDLNALARMELAARGLDADGQWVGFDKAAEIHSVRR